MESKTKCKCSGLLSLLLVVVLSVLALTPTAAATQAPANTVAAATATASSTSKNKVAYGATKYPSLSNVNYDTYRTLDYQERDGENTYFYDFRNTWYAGCDDLDGKYATNIVIDRQGFWGIRASINKDVLTYEAYTDLDNVTVVSVEFRTYDDVESVILDATPNAEHTCKTTNLKNGPYNLCVWFDYKHEDGEVETICKWQPVYVSDGNGWFADRIWWPESKDVKAWLTSERNELAADDVFQEWMAKNGGNDLAAALRLDNITYPFYSNTKQYPNETPKWQALAHEICPDENTGDFTKAYLIHDWMAHNLVYDQREIKDADGYPRSEHLPYRWAENGGGEWTMWNTHIGVCFDFANVYAIMCRELGVPCRIVSDEATNHGYNAVYLNGRWELVDLVSSCGSVYIENTKSALQEFWDNWEGSYKADLGLGFMERASFKYKIWDHQKDKFTDVKEKLIKFYPLDRDLCTKKLLQSFGGKYNH